jgi:hypothetical protein
MDRYPKSSPSAAYKREATHEPAKEAQAEGIVGRYRRYDWPEEVWRATAETRPGEFTVEVHTFVSGECLERLLLTNRSVIVAGGASQEGLEQGAR